MKAKIDIKTLASKVIREYFDGTPMAIALPCACRKNGLTLEQKVELMNAIKEQL